MRSKFQINLRISQWILLLVFMSLSMRDSTMIQLDMYNLLHISF